MKTFPVPSVALLVALTLNWTGCGKKETSVDATQPLAESFQAAEPEVRQTIQTVNASLQSGDYLAAARAMEPVLTRPDLTDPQKQAIGLALSQMNRAVAANPALDSRELYELRARMFQAMRGNSRF